MLVLVVGTRRIASFKRMTKAAYQLYSAIADLLLFDRLHSTEQDLTIYKLDQARRFVHRLTPRLSEWRSRWRSLSKIAVGCGAGDFHLP